MADDLVIQALVVSFALEFSFNFVFVDDKVRPHHVHIVYINIVFLQWSSPPVHPTVVLLSTYGIIAKDVMLDIVNQTLKSWLVNLCDDQNQ